jgi:APA family basic amino acid/polyamine antiporter
MSTTATTSTAVQLDTEFKRGLGLYASTMVVVGSMIGSGIFLVSAEMGRQTGSPGLLLTAWVLTGVLTLAAALSYGELAAMMPRAGGSTSICARRSHRCGASLRLDAVHGDPDRHDRRSRRRLRALHGLLVPWFAEDHYLIPPIHLSAGYAVSLSTVQLLASCSSRC